MNRRIDFGHYNVQIVNPDDATPIVDLDKLADALPHGSGLDGSYNIEISENGDLNIGTAFHQMDENGFYDGWVSVTIAIRRVTERQTNKLGTPGYVQILAEPGDVTMDVEVEDDENDIGDYLNDVFSYSLESLVTHMRSACIGPNGRPARFENGGWKEEEAK